ncbi:3814_t:CDS:2, partial [Acaulospora colombiana]
DGEPHSTRIPYQILVRERLKCIHMENCDIQADFIESLLGNQEAGNGLIHKLEELSFILCNLEVSIQNIRTRISSTTPTAPNLLALFLYRSEGENIQIKVLDYTTLTLRRLMPTIVPRSFGITSLELQVGSFEDGGSMSTFLTNLTFPFLGRLVIRLETCLFDLLGRSKETRLYLEILGGPLTIGNALAGHPIYTITESNGIQLSEAAQFDSNNATHLSFPALKGLIFKGFLSFLDTIEAPVLMYAKYEYECRGKFRDYGAVHTAWLNSQIKKLHLQGVKLDLSMNPFELTNLTWLCLDRITVVGPFKSWLFLPNLRTLIWKLDEVFPATKKYFDEVLSEDGIFGPMGNLHTLELHSFPLKNGNPHIARLPHQILLNGKLKFLRMENCDIQNDFLDSLLGTQE